MAAYSKDWKRVGNIQDKDLAAHVGDCADWVEWVQRKSGLPAINPRPGTMDLAGSSNYRPLRAGELPQMGDVINQRDEAAHWGHMGLATGTFDRRGGPRGMQNGDSGVRVIRWQKGVRGLPDAAPVIYRRQVPIGQ